MILAKWAKDVTSCEVYQVVSYQPLLVKCLIAALSFVILTLVFDCWFAPFLCHGYQLTTCFFILSCVGAWVCFRALAAVSQARDLWDIKPVLEKWAPSLIPVAEEATEKPGLAASADPIGEEIQCWLDCLVNESIRPWYTEIHADPAGLEEIRLLLEDITVNLRAVIQTWDSRLVAREVLAILRRHVGEYVHVLASSSQRTKAETAFAFKNVCISEADVEGSFNYANAAVAGDKEKVTDLLETLSTALLQGLMPGNVQDCSTTFTIVSSLVARQVLQPLVDILSRPEEIYRGVGLALAPEPLPNYQIGGNGSSHCPVPCLTSPSVAQTGTSYDQDKNPTRTSLVEEINTKHNLPQPPPINNSPIRKRPPLRKVAEEEEEDKTDASSVAEAQVHIGSPLVAGKGSEKTVSFKVIKTNTQVTENKKPAVNGIAKPQDLPLPHKPIQNERSTSAESVPIRLDDISPVYEDVEDFATTIAKLRSLLEQRDSQQSLGSDQTDGSSSRKSLTEGSSKEERESVGYTSEEANGDSSSEEVVEAPEVPHDDRPFVNVRISNTETQFDASGSQYSLYCVQYEGIYAIAHSKAGVDEKYSGFASLLRSEMPQNVNASPTNGSKLVLQPVLVKRRFREFLQLHSCLEEHPKWRQYMRGIRGPSKWLNLPFSKLDQNTISHRRLFLERYLQQLCNNAGLCRSPDLRNFLAYSAPSPVHSTPGLKGEMRLDKILVKTVTDVFHTIKTALPSFDLDTGGNSNVGSVPSMPSQTVPQPQLIGGWEPFMNNRAKSGSTSSVSSREEVKVVCQPYQHNAGDTEDLLHAYLTQSDARVDSAYEALDSKVWSRSTSSHSSPGQASSRDLQDKFTRNDNKCCQVDEWNSLDEELPLTCSVMHLTLATLTPYDLWLSQAPVVWCVKLALGKWMEAYLQEFLKTITSRSALASYLRSLRETIWCENPVPVTPCELSVIREHAKLALINALPGWSSFVIGCREFQDAIEMVLSCFLYPTLNRDLVLSLLQYVVWKLLPEQRRKLT